MIEQQILDNRDTSGLPINYKLIIDYKTFVKAQETLINWMKKIYIK